MEYFSIAAQYAGKSYSFILRTPDKTDLDKKVANVIDEKCGLPEGVITYTETAITEKEFNSSNPAIKWDSNELEAYTMRLDYIMQANVIRVSENS